MYLEVTLEHGFMQTMEWILDGKSFSSKTCCWLPPPPSDYSDKTGHHHHEHTVNHGTLRDISSPTSTIYKLQAQKQGNGKTSLPVPILFE
ncbi:hypothetical protein OIU74_019356 [Salix koriyanagi]|uniref:Uncharacterized protein n=1 Tax=Salix koriyanagi TaxID=2511006 RepID=A0A9Q0P3C0_9ROSI|nr:hypothetical protein OIU74_019356 [Salix koriyanagi]